MSPQQSADNLLHIWQLQRRIGIKPEHRELPPDEQYARDLEVIRKCLARA